MDEAEIVMEEAHEALERAMKEVEASDWKVQRADERIVETQKLLQQLVWKQSEVRIKRTVARNRQKLAQIKYAEAQRVYQLHKNNIALALGDGWI